MHMTAEKHLAYHMGSEYLPIDEDFKGISMTKSSGQRLMVDEFMTEAKYRVSTLLELTAGGSYNFSMIF